MKNGGFARPRRSRRVDANPRMRICVDPARAEDQRDDARKDGETVFLVARGEGNALSPSLEKPKSTALAVVIHDLIVKEGGSRPVCTQDGSQVIDAKG